MTTLSPSERDEIRECLSRMGNAFVSLLGNQPDPDVADRLRELGGISREIADMCDRVAARCQIVDGVAVTADPRGTTHHQ